MGRERHVVIAEEDEQALVEAAGGGKPEVKPAEEPAERELRFTNDWFERDAKAKFEKFLLGENVNSYLEIGCCEGASMHWVLTNLKPTHAVGIDPYYDRKKQSVFDGYRANAMHNLSPWLQSGTLTIEEERSDKQLARMLAAEDGDFDLIYVDGAHSGYSCLLDMMLSYRLLAPPAKDGKLREVQGIQVPTGGLMIVDDLHRQWQREPLVKVAVHEFELIMHTRMMKLWQHGRQCCFVRTG